MLIHYVIVRKDLPLGVMVAQTIHAAGESAAFFEAESGWRYTGCAPAFEGCTAVALGVVDETDLKYVAEYFDKVKIPYRPIYESSGHYRDQLMAIGVIPDTAESLRPKMTQLDLLV